MMDDVDRATWTGTAGRGDAPAVASPRAAARRGVAVVLLVATAVVGGALAGPWDPVLRSEGQREPLHGHESRDHGDIVHDLEGEAPGDAGHEEGA